MTSPGDANPDSQTDASAKPPAAANPAAQDPDAWTVKRILDWTIDYLGKHGSESPRLDAEILLAHARGCKRIQLYTQYEQVLTDQHRAVMRELVRRRAAAEPVAYLVGHREFFSLSFEVNASVLIPRPETETLVLEAVGIIGTDKPCRVLELGTGSGCIAIAIAKQCPKATIVTVDISEAATEVAKRNAAKHEVADRIEFRIGSLFDPINDDEQFDMLVSNPPYVCTAEIAQLARDVKDHEPHSALDGGADGLDLVRTIISDGTKYLSPGAQMLIEIDPDQAGPVCEISQINEAITECRAVRDLSSNIRIMRLDT